MINTFFDELYRFNTEMNRYFNSGKNTHAASAEMNVYENMNEYVAAVKLPGVEKDDITISFKDNSLRISGIKKNEEKDGFNYHQRERFTGNFKRNIHLNDKIDPDKISAELKNGLLIIKMLKSPEAKPVNIAIK